MSSPFDRAVSKFRNRYAEYFGPAGGPAMGLRSASGRTEVLGGSDPAFTFAAFDQRGEKALATLDQLVVAEAYLSGHLDVEGDMATVLTHRNFFPDVHPLVTAWQFIKPKLTGQERSDEAWISHHYDIDADFFLYFLDRRHRCYSQAVFQDDDESLEDAMSRKLAFSLEAVEARPGHRILDVGGGWGAFTEYGGCQDMRVTSLTISRESERFLNDLIAREKIPCEVKYEHLYEHEPDAKYDSIVVLGVTEHLPDYDRSLAKYRSLLKPGGRVYLDASAKRRKFDVSTFLQRHIYPGNGSPMCLHDYLRAVAASPFLLEGVYDDAHSYSLTAGHWAERLDENRAEIERRWGIQQYRKFRLFLWGCADGFGRDDMQAYRVVLGLPQAA